MKCNLNVIYAWTCEDNEGIDQIIGAEIDGNKYPLVFTNEDYARSASELVKIAFPRFKAVPITLKKYVCEKTLCSFEASLKEFH